MEARQLLSAAPSSCAAPVPAAASGSSQHVAASPRRIRLRLTQYFSATSLFGSLSQSLGFSSPASYQLLGVHPPTSPMSYTINPNNGQGLAAGFIARAVSAAAETWDAAAPRELFTNAYHLDPTASTGADSRNVILFKHLRDNSVLATTTLYLDPDTLAITEFDMAFNTTYRWGNARLNPSRMDLQSIATHEFGHSLGLSDLTGRANAPQTMYLYQSAGATSARTLASGDRLGLAALLRL